MLLLASAHLALCFQVSHPSFQVFERVVSHGSMIPLPGREVQHGPGPGLQGRRGPVATGREVPTVRLTLRFYGELNDHLPRSRRQVEFAQDFPDGATVRHAVEGAGVPHVEVDLVLANGSPVGWAHVPREGDRLAVYPAFHSLDPDPLVRLGPRPLEVPRFVLDVHLEGLARNLRMLGFDTLLLPRGTAPELQDPELARLSSEGRTLLTRDRDLLKRSTVERGSWVRTLHPRAQVVEILRRFDLVRQVQPFARCTVCNGQVRAVAAEDVLALVPPAVLERHDRLWQCPGCVRVYWEGTHYDRMQRFVEEVLSEAGA